MHTDIMVFAPWLNSLLFACIIYWSGVLMSRFEWPSKWYKWVLLAVIVISPSLLEIYSMLWSETLFLLLVFAFIWCLRKYLAGGHRLSALLLLCLVTAVACVTRYAGITLIVAGGGLLIFMGPANRMRRGWHLLIFIAGSSLLLTVNLYRNMHVADSLTGMRQQSLTPFFTNVHYYSNIAWEWLQFPAGQYAFSSVIGILVLMGLVFDVARRLYRRKPASYELVADVFLLGYLSFIIISATVSRYEQVNNRLLSPAFIPLAWLVTRWVYAGFRYISRKDRRVWMEPAVWIAAICVFALFEYRQWSDDRDMYRDIQEDGIPGYTARSLQRSPIVEYLKKNIGEFDPKHAIYSNVNDAVYFFTGRQNLSIPEKSHVQEAADYLRITPPHYIIWFSSSEVDDPEILRIEKIREVRRLDTLQQFADGGIYWCR